MLCHSFVFIAPSSPVLYTLSLHDALPISVVEALTQIASPSAMRLLEKAIDDGDRDVRIAAVRFLGSRGYRSEEHTSELQSLTNLVCRLLLDKKNRKHRCHRYGGSVRGTPG